MSVDGGANPGVPELIRLSQQRFQAGDLRGAEHFCRMALASDPNHGEALHLLGGIAYSAGNASAAVACLQQAIRIAGPVPLYLENFAKACRRHGADLATRGKLKEAEPFLRESVRLLPDHSVALMNLGSLLVMENRAVEAIPILERCAALAPQSPEVQQLFAYAYYKIGAYAEAERRLRLCLSLKPDFPLALNDLANVYSATNRTNESIACLQQAIRLKPDFAEAIYNLANHLKSAERFQEADALYQRSLQLNPEMTPALTNRSLGLIAMNRPFEAVSLMERAVALAPDQPEVWLNLGVARVSCRRYPEAVEAFDRCLALAPENVSAHWNRAFCYLIQEQFELGWSEYEWRWKLPDAIPRDFQQPEWDGAELGGRTVLLHTEQGLGDTLQFLRFAFAAKQRGGRVILETPKSLARLLQAFAGADEVVSKGNPLPPFDVHAPLMSLPRILKRPRDLAPATVPYLSADVDVVARWKERFDTIDASRKMGRPFRIGCCWEGSQGSLESRRRTFPLRCLDGIVAIPGVRLVRLQKSSRESVTRLSDMELVNEDLDAAVGPFMDTAAIISLVDLVITCDTAMSHLAGALGANVWLALSFSADWRSFLRESESLWYPKMRLYRQANPGDWDGVFRKIEQDIRSLVAGGTTA